MYSVFVQASCILVAVSQLGLVHSKFETDNEQLFLDKYSIPDETPDPINIDTKKVYQVKLSPLQITGAAFAFTKLSNTGKSVESSLFQPFTISQITGSVLGSAIYQFVETHSYWTNDLNGTSGSSIDDQQFPLQYRAYFRNRKYPTKIEALKHRDGFVAMVLPFCIGSIPNKLFDVHGTKLKLIREPGSSTLEFLGSLIVGTDAVPVNSTYYAYPGSYIDDITGKRYSCATVLVFKPNPISCISEEQFKTTFGSLKNSSGEPLTNILSQYSATMPIVQANGVIQTVLPVIS